MSINDPKGMGTIDGSEPLTGILGSILGETPAAQKARLEEAAKSAQDLTKLVKRKRPAGSESSKFIGPDSHPTIGKRKVDFSEEIEAVGMGKRARKLDGDDGSVL